MWVAFWHHVTTEDQVQFAQNLCFVFTEKCLMTHVMWYAICALLVIWRYRRGFQLLKCNKMLQLISNKETCLWWSFNEIIQSSFDEREGKKVKCLTSSNRLISLIQNKGKWSWNKFRDFSYLAVFQYQHSVISKRSWLFVQMLLYKATKIGK